jgi:hypothetical protein
MEGFSMPQFTNRHLALHAKLCPIGPQIHCSTSLGISTPLTLLLQPSQAWPSQACLITLRPPLLRPTKPAISRPKRSPPGLHPSALPGPRPTGPLDLRQAPTLQAHQARMISAGPRPLRPTRRVLHRPSRSPQWQASAYRPMVPCPPATCHRRAPNLLRRHR